MWDFNVLCASNSMAIAYRAAVVKHERQHGDLIRDAMDVSDPRQAVEDITHPANLGFSQAEAYQRVVQIDEDLLFETNRLHAEPSVFFTVWRWWYSNEDWAQGFDLAVQLLGGIQ